MNPFPPPLDEVGVLSAITADPAGADVSFPVVTANDAEDGTLTASCSPVSGSHFPVGMSPVACTAVDSGGLSVTGAFTVRVVFFNEAPVVTAPASVGTATYDPDGTAVMFSVSANDLEDGVLPVDCDHTSGSDFPIGSTQVTCSATDTVGQTSTASFPVQLELLPPKIVQVFDKRAVVVDWVGFTEEDTVRVLIEDVDGAVLNSFDTENDGEAFTTYPMSFVGDRIYVVQTLDGSLQTAPVAYHIGG